MELRHHFTVMHDGPRDELGEKQYEQAVILKSEWLYTLGMDVDQESDFLKRNEGDSQRENHLREDKIRAEYVVDCAASEVDIFEIAEERDIECDAQQQN